jgi:hypothetical protein
MTARDATTDRSPFGGDWWDDLKRRTADAAANPEPGMGFHEMYSCWVFVTGVTDDEVQVVRGGGHPSWFPECGLAKTIPRAEFPKFVQYEVLADRRYAVDGWAARAEGITVEELERRILATGKRGEIR